MFPDVNKTPAGPGSIPVPYPNLDEAKDALENTAKAVGEAVSGGARAVADGVEIVGKAVGDAAGLFASSFSLPGFDIGDVLKDIENMVKNPVEGIIKNPIGTIVDILPGIIVDIFQPIDLPGLPNPGTTPGAPDLEGLDPMTALFVIMSYMEERLGSTMEKLATLVEVQSRLQDAASEDLQNGIDKDDPKSATSAARAEIGKEFGEEFENMDLTTVSSAINALTFQVQRTESFRQQLNTMVSNLQKSDHEAKMVTLRNIPTR